MKRTLLIDYILHVIWPKTALYKCSRSSGNLFATKKVSKFLLALALAVFILPASATVYYISSTTGNDANSGTSTGQAWKTLEKVNSFIPKPGDQILFKSGDEWYGTLTVKASGSSVSPIVYGAYGTGAKPIITGFTSVTAWTNKGGNIWESTNAVSTLSTCNMVVINGVNTPMGRDPKFRILLFSKPF